MSDQELIKALCDGRAEEAFTRLYRQLPDVVRMVRTHGGTKAEANDLFQDALVILHERVTTPDFQITGTVPAYLFGICRHRWLYELRERGREEKHITALAATPAGAADDAVAPGGDEPLMQLAERAFAMLGEKCRELLTRFYLNNEPLQAIAHAFGFAGEGAAKTRKYKCLEQAREKYRLLLSNTNTL